MAHDEPKERQINFRVSEPVYAALVKGAKDAKMSLASWLTQLGLTATGQSALSDQLARVAGSAPGTKRAKRGRGR